MKAIVFTEYGSPDVLSLQEVEKPVPTDDEVLLQVHAASVNPLDWHTMRGEPFIARLDGGFRKPKTNRLGVDVAGIVAAVGKNVTQFKAGDEVFGESRFGSLGEYVCALPDKLVPKPANLTFEEGAGVAVGGITALQSLAAKGPVQPGQSVLINGGSGGVGTFTVQLARHFGANITAVCSTRNLDLVRSLGADRVIDYTKEDFIKSGQTYDLVIDNVGNYSVSNLRRVLKPEGNCVIVGFTSLGLLFQGMVVGPLTSRGKQKVGTMGMAQINKKDIEFLSELLATRKIVTVIDRCYPLKDAPEAIRYLETGHARAKVIIQI